MSSADPGHAAEGLRTITALAAEVGLEHRLADARPVNSYDTHRLLHLGKQRGVGDAMWERMMRGYTAEGAYLGDLQTLVRLATEAGLDARHIEAVLDGDDFGDEVRADEALARRFGIRAVPTFVFDFTGRRLRGRPRRGTGRTTRTAWQAAA